MDDAQLRTVWQQRQIHDRGVLLSQPLGFWMKHTLVKRFRQLGGLAKAWDQVIPAEIAEHTALESYQGGVLTVLVDSSAHRYQLQTLLSAGLTGQIRSRFSGPLNKVRLVQGQFSSIDLAGQPRYRL